MNILVIGGNRFFGRRLVEMLMPEGHSITVANRGSKPGIFSRSVETLVVNRTSKEAMEHSFRRREFDLVYDQICNTGAEARIAKSVFKDTIGKMVFTSTGSVYDEAANRDESFFQAAHFDPSVASRSDYQHGKREAEWEYLDAEFPVVAVRLPVVVGLDDYKRRVHWHIDRVMKHEDIYFPDINARYSFIHALDAAKFLLWAGSNDLGRGAINAASPDPIKLCDFMKWIEDATGKSARYDTGPSAENHSPFGISSDCFFSVKRASQLGYEFSRAHDWFPELIGDLSTSYDSWS